jgi:HSP20 family molecular chaperone IbpA
LKELSKRTFSRRFTLNQDLGDPQVATVKDGILTLRWPIKKQKQPEKRLIKIQQG